MGKAKQNLFSSLIFSSRREYSTLVSPISILANRYMRSSGARIKNPCCGRKHACSFCFFFLLHRIQWRKKQNIVKIYLAQFRIKTPPVSIYVLCTIFFFIFLLFSSTSIYLMSCSLIFLEPEKEENVPKALARTYL